MMQAGAVRESTEEWKRFRYVTARQNVHPGVAEGHHTGVSVVESSLRVDIHASGEGVEPLIAQSGPYTLVGR
jgi:hypothetical protein